MLQVRCNDALSRWRRLHTRASIADLKTTLQEIDRGDIIQKIEEPRRKRKKKQVRVQSGVKNLHEIKAAVRNFVARKGPSCQLRRQRTDMTDISNRSVGQVVPLPRVWYDNKLKWLLAWMEIEYDRGLFIKYNLGETSNVCSSMHEWSKKIIVIVLPTHYKWLRIHLYLCFEINNS